MGTIEVEVLTGLVSNGVHGQRWPDSVYAVALYTANGRNLNFIARNVTKTEHAEDCVLNFFQVLLQHKILQPQVVKLFLSASPCQRCSQRIISFLETAWWFHGIKLEMEIVISAFYRIRRPSCEQNPFCHDHLPSYDCHLFQVDGLKKLYRTPGVVLRTVDLHDWMILGNVLGVRNMCFCVRIEEDFLLKKDFEQIMDIFSLTIGVPEENGLTNPSCLKGTIPAILQPKTGPAQEASGDKSPQDEKSTDKNPITSQEHHVQNASRDLSSEHQGTQKVTCKDSETMMTNDDTESIEIGQGETGRVSVNKKGNLDKETQTDHFTPEKVKADKETETVEKEKLEKETQSEPLQSYKVTVDKEKFEVELMELKLQVARRQYELEVEILQSKKECSRLKRLKLYYEVRKLEKQLGVSDNTWVTADVPFKVDE